jgi:hypothetical protein
VTASGTMKDVPCDCKNLVPASWAVKIYLSLRHDDPYVGPALNWLFFEFNDNSVASATSFTSHLQCAFKENSAGSAGQHVFKGCKRVGAGCPPAHIELLARELELKFLSPPT